MEVLGDANNCVNDLTNLKELKLNSDVINFDISDVKNLVNLHSLDLRPVTVPNRNIKGDIKNLSSLTNLDNYIILSSGVTGDIKNMANCKNLVLLSFVDSPVYGKAKSLSGLDKLENLYVNFSDVEATNDDFKEFKSLKSWNFKNSNGNQVREK